MRPNNKQVKLLFEDLQVFLKCDRASDIMLGEWFRDGSLPIPSAELLEFFAWDLLYGFGKYERFLEVEADWKLAVLKYVIDLKMMPTDSLWNSVVYAFGRRRIAELSGKRLHVLHWWPALTAIDLDGIIQIEGGKRKLTRFVLESMTLRATFMGDVPYLEGLVEAVKENRDNLGCKPQKVQLIAFRMLQWHGHISQKLGRSPSKFELEKFIQEVYPEISDAAATWSNALKLVDLPFSNLRGKKISDKIVSLALAARETGPVVTRMPSWRTIPKNDFQK